MWAAVSFDLDNTLVERDAAVQSVLEAHLPPALVLEALAIDDSGRGTSALFRWLQERLPSLGSRDAVARWFRGTLLQRITQNPAVSEAVRRIARRHRTVVVSNGGAGQRRKLAAAGLADAFEHIVVSADVRARKPEPKIFARATALLGVCPASVLHVGDDPVADVAGASAAGLATCWVARGGRFPEGLPSPTLQVQDVAELAEVLSC